MTLGEPSKNGPSNLIRVEHISAAAMAVVAAIVVIFFLARGRGYYIEKIFKIDHQLNMEEKDTHVRFLRFR